MRGAQLHGYRYPEAYCLMLYRSAKTHASELIWNSRDGVTPYVIRSPDGTDELEHVTWEADVVRRGHVPEIGERIFVNLTMERAREIARERMSRMWTDATYAHIPESERDAAVERVARDIYGCGELPTLVTVTDELWAEIERDPAGALVRKRGGV